uniref:Arginine-glutamic acid dipeptide repeats protein n=1 Tax=Lygus hesperus TaxID=30085 RepID=A0A0A9XRV4_LYGHE
MRVLWFLVILGFGKAQFYPPVDFSNGCTVPADNYGQQQQPILLPPMMCHLVMRESARALGLLEPFVPMQTNNQLHLTQRAMHPGVMSDMCNPPITVGRAIECRRSEPQQQQPQQPPPMHTGRAVECPQAHHQTGRGLECPPSPPPTPLASMRAVDCAPFDCYQPPPQTPVGRGLDCSLVPIPAARFVGCAPNLLQEAEPVVQPTLPPCPAVCNSLCTGCQPTQHGARLAEEAQIDLNPAGRGLAGSQYSYNIIPVKLKSKTSGADDQITNHLLLLQLKPDSQKEEPAADSAQRTNAVRSL